VNKLKIFVCVKQVPGVAEVHIDPKTNTLIRQGIPSVLNSHDKHAIELALQIKEKYGGDVIAISMGPPQAEQALREVLSMGADKAYLLTDRTFAGADTLATSYTLALAVKKILSETNEKKDYLVICGIQAYDGDTAQVPPEMAEELEIPQITYVSKFELKGNKVIVERAFRKEEAVVIETELPVLISVVKDINKPRNPSIQNIVEAYQKKKIIPYNAKDLNAKRSKIGLKGSPTEVWKIYLPERKGEHKILSGSDEEVALKLVKNLKKDKII
jgi:electron transfer flavoprotein beta subunit